MKKINFRGILLILFACFAALLTVAILFQSRPKLEPLPKPPTVTTTHRSVSTTTKPQGYDSAYFMNFKNRGDCKALKGKVLLNFYLVSDGGCLWTEKDENKFRQDVADEIHLMNLDAQRFQIPLAFCCNFIPLTMPEQMIRDESDHYIPKLLQALGVESKNTMLPALAAESGCDSAAVLFCFNRDERSFALSTTAENGFEYCVLYSGARAFRHELYHVYGARDLYTPEHINTIAIRFFPDSIMRKSGSMVVDPLTAFTLGWSDHLDDRVREFLETVDR